MDNLLKNWGFEEFISTFKENDITIENIFKLSEEMIKELIPSVGLRVNFLEKFNEAKHVNDISFNDNASDTIEGEYVVANNGELSRLNQSILSHHNSESTESVSSDANQTASFIPTQNREVSFYGAENFFAAVAPVFPDFDLKTLLQTSPLGNSVLNYYNANQTLDHTRRGRMVDIIMKHIFNFILKHRLKHDDYNVLTAKIIALFPKETASTYYVPSIKKRNSHCGRSILARGRLVDKSRNLLHLSGASNARSKRKFQEISDNPSGDESLLKRINISETVENAIVWLQHSSEPWEEVTENWKITFSVRVDAQTDSHTCGTVEEFLKQWPILKDLRAVSLIDLDFEHLYPGCSFYLLHKWDTFFNELLTIKRDQIRDKKAIELLSQLDEQLDSDSKVAIQLNVLPHLLPPKGRINIGRGKHWKFSIQETIESFIVHAKNPGDISRLIDQEKAKALARQHSVQPYLLIVGPSLTEIQTTYIVVDNIQYQFNSVLKALDICFKCFHVFHSKYPPQGEHLWLLIQQALLNINTKYDKILPYIADLIERLKQLLHNSE